MSLVDIPQSALKGISDQATLYEFLRRELHWPVSGDDTYTYDGPALDEGLVGDVQVGEIVPFDSAAKYNIFLVEFSGSVRRSHLREILRAIKKEERFTKRYGIGTIQNIVFVIAEENYREIRFAQFRERTGRQPELKVFGWNTENPSGTRTIREVSLQHLRVRSNLLGEIEWKNTHWEDAWNVEKVTKEFFDKFAVIFEAFINSPNVQNVTGDRRLFALRTFNRLMFLQFLAKKRWLNDDKQYLHNLRKVAEDNASLPSVTIDQRTNFYSDYLWPLFFSALNQPNNHRNDAELSRVQEKLGRIPYLNGGLFSPVDEDDQLGAVTIANQAFDGLLQLFEDYNFTIEESAPDDVEVAIDPEMLGKVFEQLMTREERHGSGSYYTPRPIVSYMCRESLKHYLGGSVSVAKFVDEGDSSLLTNPEGVLDKLKHVTICDPACGSGAYLLGAMQEILRLRAVLFNNNVGDYAAVYQRKLEIIQRNIYGADLSDFAVNMAMLRLWLALVVDNDAPLQRVLDGNVDVSLPNLRFKIVRGDSLSVPLVPHGKLATGLFAHEYLELAQRLQRLHQDYFTGRDIKGIAIDHDATLEQITATKESIRTVLKEAFGERGNNGLDWQAEYAEVFAAHQPVSDIGGAMNFGQSLIEEPEPGGFDILLANPPYIRHEKLGPEQKIQLKIVHKDVFAGTADIYVFFYHRGVELLKPGGTLAYISSNKWFKAAYGESLRKFMSEQTSVRNIIDFGELPVFPNVATFPMVMIASKGGPTQNAHFTQVQSLNEPYPDVLELTKSGIDLPKEAISGSKWTLAGSGQLDILDKMEKAGVPLGEYVNGQIYYGIKTGFNAAFVIDGAKRAELIAQDSRCSEVIKPLVVGDDVRRWNINYEDQWMIYSPWDFRINEFPIIKTHLAKWQNELQARPECKSGRYPWWSMARYGAEYAESFLVPKIMYPVIGKESRFAFDSLGAYTNDKVFMIPANDLYLLGVLNSSCVWKYLESKCSSLGDALKGGRLELRSIYVRPVPIPDASTTDRTAISALVQKCLDARGVDCAAWEAEINGRVAALYGL